MIDYTKKRFKAIADYPSRLYNIGEVIEWEKDQINLIAFYRQYPNLFKELQWWEEREKEDMPDYVKQIDCEDGHTWYFMNGQERPVILKIIAHFRVSIYDDLRGHDKRAFVCDWNNMQLSYGAFQPATEEEYLTYIQSKK